jgi:hypothetical protein
MRCKHCLVEFHAESCQTDIAFANAPYHRFTNGKSAIAYKAVTQVCPSCEQAHITLVESAHGKGKQQLSVFPRGGPAAPPPPEVPAQIAADYRESNEVLRISPKASAALSRRCLQAVLASAGYTSTNLAKQVQEAIDQTDPSKVLPPDIRDSMDAIRNFGNFSAHPINDVSTSQVIEVEPGEAEWCLELLGELFQHFYVRPQRAARRREALNQKLAAAGKPEMKAGEQQSLPQHDPVGDEATS